LIGLVIDYGQDASKKAAP